MNKTFQKIILFVENVKRMSFYQWNGGTKMKTYKIIKADMLGCCGNWIKNQELDATDFCFVADYTDICKRVQIWKGSNEDFFILKNVEIKKVEE